MQHATVGAALLTFSLSAAAQTTVLVDSSGGGAYLTIDGAFNDPTFVYDPFQPVIIDVAPGVYPAFTVPTLFITPELTIRQEPGTFSQGDVTVDAGSSTGNCLGRALTIEPQVLSTPSSPGVHRLIRIERLIFTGGCTQGTGLGGTDGFGGGVIVGAGTTIFNGCTFTGNAALGIPQLGVESKGGGVYVEPDPNFGTAAPCAPDIFGADNCFSSTVFSNCIFEDNVADLGGGIAAERTTQVSILNCVIDDNEAGDDGGGLWTERCDTLLARDSIFSLNRADSGGAAYASSDGLTATEPFINVNFERCTFDDNDALAGDGGAIRVVGENPGFNLCGTAPRSIVDIDECEFELNEASGSGGAVAAVSRVTTSIDYSYFHLNMATVGGALHGQLTSEVEVTNSQFDDNSAETGGAFLFTEVCSAPIRSSLFVNNTATDDFFFANGGGAGRIAVTNSTIDFCTFADNNSAPSVGASALSIAANGAVTIDNSIFWGNSNPADAIEITGGTVPIDATNYESLALAAFPCTCIDDDPQFATSTAVGVQPTQVNRDYFLGLGTIGDPNDSLDAANTTPDVIGGTTAIDLSLDVGAADLGFHYSGNEAPDLTSVLRQTISPGGISVTNGGTATFELFPQTNVLMGAGNVRLYALLGSFTGTAPGIPVDNGVLPIFPDAYTIVTITGGGGGFFTPTTINPLPVGTPSIVTTWTANPGQLPPALAGGMLYHAFLLLEQDAMGVLQAEYDPSNSVEFEVGP